MKKFIPIIVLFISNLFAQFNYPAEDFLGGGIGYSPMYIKLNGIPGASSLSNFGLDTTKFDDPFVIHGGEGFAHITGRWRLGGYAGMGSSTISSVPTAVIFIDEDGNNKKDPGENTQKEYDGYYGMSIRAKFSFMLGAASVEYVMPLLQDLELSTGALLGLGRVNMGIEQKSGSSTWEKVFENAYGEMNEEKDTLYYGVSENEYDNTNTFSPLEIPSFLRDVSATFFNFQPYLAIKWQFLERLGLRISLGFNKGTINAGNWKLNGRFIEDSPTTSVSGVSFRTMLYLGL
tara:strand:- start:1315 stop:2181 length:867 start_codon:yes stop_codon:yes gene_type:complete